MTEARSQIHRILTPVLAATACLAATTVWADPAGSVLRVDQQAIIRIDMQRIGIQYSVTLNRPGAFQEFLDIDADGDGEVSMSEQDKYFDKVRRQIMAGLEITVDGRELPLRQAGEMMLVMPFTKIFRFETDQPPAWEGGVELELHNDNFLVEDGDAAIRVESGDGVKLNFCSLSQPGEPSGTGADLPSPSFTPRQQRDVLVRYSNTAGLHGQPSNATFLTSTTQPQVPEPKRTPTAQLESASFDVGLVALALLVASVVVLLWRGAHRGVRQVALATAATCLVVVCAAWSVHTALATSPVDVTPLNDDEAKTIFHSLHENIYAAFQTKTENDLYNVLAASLDGELLNRTYLQIRRCVMSDDLSQSFYVRRIKPLATEILPHREATEAEFRARCRWRVYGVVSHFGHRHTRVNEYEATFAVEKQGSDWRITRADLRSFQRTDADSLF